MGQRLLPRGILVVFEGIDGAGKTTQATRLAKNLRAMGLDVVESKEPTNGPWGQQLRASASTGRLDPREELDLFVRDRRDHVRNLIEPAVADGKVVIVDRYYFSTAAYQGARGMDFEEILALNESFAPQPDLLFILEVNPKVGRTRIAARGDQANLFEDEAALAASAAIFSRIERPYLRRLDGTRSISELEHITMLAIGPLLEKPPGTVTPDTTAERAELVRKANDLLADDSIPAEEKAAALLSRVLAR